MEVRKVEIFRDGSVGLAGRGKEEGGSFLGLEPTPENEEIARDPQFKLDEIDGLEFQRIWELARVTRKHDEK
jgi:hypothetical protein